MPVASSSGIPDVKKPVNSAVRCKVCGYITDAANVKDLCPACGVKAAMFEPLTEKFSDDRRKYLDLHIHPIIVHFPQAFAGTLFALMALMLFTSGALRQIIADAVTVISVGLPITVIASFVSGIKDGTVRYKKITTPFLRLKITVGIIYTILSIVNITVVFLTPWTTPTLAIVTTLIALGLVVCTTALGKIGAELSCARMPG